MLSKCCVVRSVNNRNLISVPFQPDPPSSNNGFHIALFNAQSVCSAEKREEISTFVSDNQIDVLFIMEIWLNPHGDEATVADLAPSTVHVRGAI